MADFPDFTIPKWDRRDWAAKEATFKTWALYSVDPVDPGDSSTITVYTIPTGKIFYYADSYLGSEFRGRTYLYVYGSYFFHLIIAEPYDTSIKIPSIPLTAEAGEQIKVKSYNEDIIAGRIRYGLSGWEEVASRPKNPKSDDPEERYKLGDFNFANIGIFPNGELLIIFGKKGERKRNYLRMKNLYQPKEKKLASSHLKLKEAQEIIDITRDKPEKVKAVLEKYEKKYKSRSAKSF